MFSFRVSKLSPKGVYQKTPEGDLTLVTLLVNYLISYLVTYLISYLSKLSLVKLNLIKLSILSYKGLSNFPKRDLGIFSEKFITCLFTVKEP